METRRSTKTSEAELTSLVAHCVRHNKKASGGAKDGGHAGGAAATAGIDEEVEDADGNVYTRKTYEDLKRQGLL